MNRLPSLASLFFIAGCAGEYAKDTQNEDVAPLVSSCSVGADCTDGLGCVGGSCAPCTRHAQCASDVCDPESETIRGTGHCWPEELVLYVGGPHSTCDGATGTRSAPFCQLRHAVAAIGAAKRVIRVYGGHHLPFSLKDVALTIFGPDDASEAVEIDEEDMPGITVSGRANVLLAGLKMGRTSRYGLRCSAGARVNVRRSELISHIGVALQAEDCVVEMDRVRVSGEMGALALQDTRFDISNSVITGATEGTAIRAIRSIGDFRFVSVVENHVEVRRLPTIDCGNLRIRLTNSIVANNGPSSSSSQFAGACELDHVVTGRFDMIRAEGAIRLDPVLQGHVLPWNEANLSCCIDKASPDPSIRADFAGTRRPQGAGYDIGAYEAPSSPP